MTGITKIYRGSSKPTGMRSRMLECQIVEVGIRSRGMDNRLDSADRRCERSDGTGRRVYKETDKVGRNRSELRTNTCPAFLRNSLAAQLGIGNYVAHLTLSVIAEHIHIHIHLIVKVNNYNSKHTVKIYTPSRTTVCVLGPYISGMAKSTSRFR